MSLTLIHSVPCVNLVVTATVTETSGVPPPNNAESRVTQIINIMQFAEFSLELEEAIVTVYAGSDINLELKIYNTGNWVDRFLISMETESLENVNLSLPASAVQIESRSAPHRFRVQLIAPATGSDWPINSDGLHTMEIEFDITVKSDFSCTQTSGCMSETVTQKVIFLQNQTAEEKPESSLLNWIKIGLEHTVQSIHNISEWCIESCKNWTRKPHHLDCICNPR